MLIRNLRNYVTKKNRFLLHSGFTGGVIHEFCSTSKICLNSIQPARKFGIFSKETSLLLNIGNSSVLCKFSYASSTAVDFDYSSKQSKKIATNKEEYLKLCEKIVKLDDSSNLTLRELAYLPSATSEFHEYDYFVKEVSQCWWKHVETRLLKFSPKDISVMITNLQNIDYYTNGRLISTIKWTALEKLACEFFRNIENTEIFFYQSVLRNLTRFIDADSELKLSPLLHKIIIKSISSIFSGHIYFDKSDFEDHIGTILFCSAKLGLQIPSPALPVIYAACVGLFSKSKNDPDTLTECSLIGSALHTLNLNPGHTFWIYYFKSIKSKMLANENSSSETSSVRFTVTLLKTALFVGVSFCENQFKTFQPFWIDNMQRSINSFTKHEIDSVLNLCVEKYDGQLADIENVLSATILFRMLQHTDAFRLDKNANLIERTDAALATDNKSLKLGSTKYLAFCQQVAASSRDNPCNVPAASLCNLPQAAIECRDVENFVDQPFFTKWCTEMERNFSAIPGYQLVHALTPLARFYKKYGRTEILDILKTNHPDFVEKLTEHVLSSIREPNFTHNTLGMLLHELVVLQVNPGLDISPDLREKLNAGFRQFFKPKYFASRNFVARLHENVGQIMFHAVQCKLSKPSDDCMKLLVENCSKNFRLDGHASLNFKEKLVASFVDLSPGVFALVAWRADADQYWPDFWRQFFDTCRIHLHRLNMHSSWERRTKNNILTNCMLVVLHFDKETQFNESLKEVWQKEISASLNYKYHLSREKIQSVLSAAKATNKMETLDGLMSKWILDKFNAIAASEKSTTFVFGK